MGKVPTLHQAIQLNGLILDAFITRITGFNLSEDYPFYLKEVAVLKRSERGIAFLAIIFIFALVFSVYLLIWICWIAFVVQLTLPHAIYLK